DEAAFYGPKLDIQYRNVYGKEDTIVTIQIDMLLAERFGMVYTGDDGEKKTPYIIHRTSLGCYERTLAYLIEKYAGALPIWLAPEQVRVLSIKDSVVDYAKGVADKLAARGIRVESDFSSNTLGYKIRGAQKEKVPYMVIIGEKDLENGTISIRYRNGDDLGAMSFDDFLTRIEGEIAAKEKK
ncbi:MAG: threonine--tRNA ligase, partial [Thermoguttaceae bacterium]|nr:threonine--tRNA ligase [Thermoguttaceae bacterium]